MANILLITTQNLTTNPRLQKEFLKLRQDHAVQVIAFSDLGWSDTLETERGAKEQWVSLVRYIPASRASGWPFVYATMISKLAGLMDRVGLAGIRMKAWASNKRAVLLWRSLRKYRPKDFDLVLVHTLGALYPAWRWLQGTPVPWVFDVEDFHPGEAMPEDGGFEKKRRITLMRELLPGASHVHFASPLIGEAVKGLPVSLKSSSVLNNCFSRHEFVPPDKELTGRIKLVWFSQNIDGGRGLEEVIKAIAPLQDEVELHLIGNLVQDFEREWIAPNRKFIHTHLPMPQEKLHRSLMNYDVGLAMELSTADENRNLCLTNKIFAYLQSGLYILATDTQAQKRFMDEHARHGVVCGQSVEALSSAMAELVKDKTRIRSGKDERYKLADDVCWENECGKLSELIERWTNQARHA
ncbi:MAG: hypothetical protein KDD36_07230 [Flavobacteriales bacterium]|nr:hypothetical protein [Flavobacteriales bacterium]